MSDQKKRSVGRPKSDDALQVYPCRLKESTIAELRTMENHSKFVRELIEKALRKRTNARDK